MPRQMPKEFELRIWINAQPDEVFQCWARAERLSKWFQHTARHFSADNLSENRTEARSGDRYEWSLAHGHRSTGRFLEVHPAKRLVHFTFGGDSGMSTRVQIEPADGGSLVRLTQLALPAEDVECYADVKCGWTFYLSNLMAFLEHQVDLREHSPQRIRDGVLNV